MQKTLPNTPESNPNRLPPIIDFSNERCTTIKDAFDAMRESVQYSTKDKQLSQLQAVEAMFNPSAVAAPMEPVIENVQVVEPVSSKQGIDASIFAMPASQMSAYFSDQGASA